MLRSSRNLALFAALAIVAVPATARSAPTESVTVKDSVSAVSPKQNPEPMTLTLHRFETMAPNFQVDERADSAPTSDLRWGQRAQKANQKTAFDKALVDVFRHGTFSPGSFSSEFLSAVVAFAGPDNMREYARSLRLEPTQYRVVLRALNDADLRNRFTDS